MGQRGTSKQKTPKNDPPVVATTIVSSQMLGYMAKARGWDYVET